MQTLRDVMDAVAAADEARPVSATLYDDLAPLYAFERERTRDFEAVAEFVAGQAPADARRVGAWACGPGFLLERLAGQFETVVGVDASQRLLELAAERTDAPVVTADVRTVVTPGALDAVTLLGGSIAHLPAGDGEDGVRSTFASAHESLRPGGVFCCDFMRRGVLESGDVSTDRFESERYRVDRTVVTTGENAPPDALGAFGRYTFAYEITDTRTDETVRVGTETPVREFGASELLGTALNAGFADVTLVTPPTHGTGLVARRGA